MADQFLNKDGLAYLWGKVDDIKMDKSEGENLRASIEGKQDKLSAGEHINISGSTISAEGYVAATDPVEVGQVTPVVTNDMVSKGTLTFDRTKTGEFVSLTVSSSDIGEGAPLAPNSLYGVYK